MVKNLALKSLLCGSISVVYWSWVSMPLWIYAIFPRSLWTWPGIALANSVEEMKMYWLQFLAPKALGISSSLRIFLSSWQAHGSFLEDERPCGEQLSHPSWGHSRVGRIELTHGHKCMREPSWSQPSLAQISRTSQLTYRLTHKSK